MLFVLAGVNRAGRGEARRSDGATGAISPVSDVTSINASSRIHHFHFSWSQVQQLSLYEFTNITKSAWMPCDYTGSTSCFLPMLMKRISRNFTSGSSISFLHRHSHASSAETRADTAPKKPHQHSSSNCSHGARRPLIIPIKLAHSALAVKTRVSLSLSLIAFDRILKLRRDSDSSADRASRNA